MNTILFAAQGTKCTIMLQNVEQLLNAVVLLSFRVVINKDAELSKDISAFVVWLHIVWHARANKKSLMLAFTAVQGTYVGHRS